MMLTVMKCLAVLRAMLDDWQKKVVPLSSTSIESVWRTNVPDGIAEVSSCSFQWDDQDVWFSLLTGGHVVFSCEVCRHHWVLLGNGKPDTWQGKETASPSNTVTIVIAVLMVTGTATKNRSDKRSLNLTIDNDNFYQLRECDSNDLQAVWTLIRDHRQAFQILYHILFSAYSKPF